MKKKVKRFDGESGSQVSLEEKYPGAKITRGEYQGRHPDLPPAKNAMQQGEREQQAERVRKFIAKESLDPYEQKIEKFERSKPKGGGGSGGGGGVMPIDKMLKMNKMNYKKGGSVSSASKRADGCCIRGKTRA